MRANDLRSLDLFAGLSNEQLDQVVDAGSEVCFEPGDVLFQEGAPADFWWVLVDGALELIRHVGREDAVVGRMDVPGRWSGGFRAWDSQGVYLATGRAISAGRLLQLPADALRRLADGWFPFGAHLIEGLYGTARSIESTARQRDSLVTLGTLAAGLAHEINNPAAAATRAVDSLVEASAGLLTSLGRLAKMGIDAEQFTALDQLRSNLRPRPASTDALVAADAEDELSAWLAAHGVEQDWVVGPALAAAGADLEWCERAVDVLDPPALGPGLEWVASTVSVAGLLGEVKESTRRISELVAAVRSYSQMDRASLQQVDLTDGLESTLLVLGHRLRDGIDVVRDYGSDVPLIEGYPGELNQVWTNLIDNAVDAMDGVGTLTLAVRRASDGGVTIEVADSGEGMPTAVQARAFEAFYTTKDVGKGTGLGLDIARRIVVERHGGAIEIESEPGRTVMRVRLPVRPGGRSSTRAEEANT